MQSEIKTIKCDICYLAQVLAKENMLTDKDLIFLIKHLRLKHGWISDKELI